MMRMMRRLCAALLLAALLSAAAGLAEEDFSACTYAELVALRERLEAEMRTRPEFTTALSEGQYVAGRDIPAGTYTLTLNREDVERDYVEYYVYETQSMYAYDVGRLWLGDMPLKEGRLGMDASVTVDLYAGYCLVAYRNGLNLLLLDALEAAPGGGELPEGTLVPIGYYTVGEEIPAGTYAVHYGGRATARFRVYDTMEEAKNDFSDEEVLLIVSAAEPFGTAYLKEGQIVRVEYNDVIMKRRADLVFD